MWRETGSPVRFLIFDARVLLPLVIWFAHLLSWWTFGIAVAGIVTFGAVERLGLTFPAAVRLLRRLLVGPHRPAVPSWKRRGYA